MRTHICWQDLLRSRPLARHASERGYCADAVVRPTRIAGLVVLATLGICADARAVLVESLNDTAVRAVREVALAVGAGLDGEGHGQQGNGKGGDANHFGGLGVCVCIERGWEYGQSRSTKLPSVIETREWLDYTTKDHPLQRSFSLSLYILKKHPESAPAHCPCAAQGFNVVPGLLRPAIARPITASLSRSRAPVPQSGCFPCLSYHGGMGKHLDTSQAVTCVWSRPILAQQCLLSYLGSLE